MRSWSALRTSWRAAIAATAPGSGRRRSIPTWYGRSSRRSPKARASRRDNSGSEQMQVGFIGLGAMGALIVRRLMAAGHSVVGWNRSRDKAAKLIDAGMRWADTPRAVAEKSEILFSIVTDGAAVRAIALGDDGVLAGLRPGGVYADMSTIAPDVSRAVAAEFTKAGHAML